MPRRAERRVGYETEPSVYESDPTRITDWIDLDDWVKSGWGTIDGDTWLEKSKAEHGAKGDPVTIDRQGRMGCLRRAE